MCGIAGLVGLEGESVAAASIHSMCQTIVHRGPDDEGIYAKDNVGMGIRRLSIIDLCGGHQPIHNEDRSVWVVFNGEIYNFPELRQELEESGHHFYTNTDTEVIVHLYEEMGSDCVRKLRGMFAIAVYDERRRSLLLARDRFGKKPLNYALHRGRLYFGSEIKTILAVAPELAQISPEALLQYFQFLYILDPRTSFKGIAKLPAGHLLEYRAGKIEVRQYWDLPDYGTCDPNSEEECLEQLEHRLAEAVRIRLISDVPLGALLSGGVDSSVIVALMARESSRPLKTFSIAFEEQDFSESQYARSVAERFATEHHELVVAPKIHETLDFLTHMMEEPFGDPSMIPTYHVCRMARKHVTVALSGDGGDELFAGYDRYAVHLNRQKYEGIPSWLGRTFRAHVYPRLPVHSWGRRFLFNLSLPPADRYIDAVSFLPALGRERSLFSSDFLAQANGHDPAQQFRDHFRRPGLPDRISRLMYLDSKTYLPGDVLTKVDRMSMATSLEVRSPMLDHVFVEWVTGLSSRWKLRLGTHKYVLKKLAQRVGVPVDVLNRPKQGFAMPLAHWWRKDLRHDLLAILLEPRTLQRGYFNVPAVRQLVEEHLNGRRNRPTDIWLLLVFELWQRNFMESLTGAPPLTSLQATTVLPSPAGQR